MKKKKKPETSSRPRAVEFDLCLLLLPDRNREYLLYFLDRDGVRLMVRSYLPRKVTRMALREAEILEYLDDILYDDESPPEPALVPPSLSECRYAWIAERVVEADRRAVHFTLDMF